MKKIQKIWKKKRFGYAYDEMTMDLWVWDQNPPIHGINRKFEFFLLII